MAFFSGNKQADDQNQNAHDTFIFELVAKNVLVTGAKGQLGSELKRVTAGHEANLNFIYTDVVDLDITDLDAVERFVKNNKIKYIINCAAYTAVDKAEDDVSLCYAINRDAVRNLAIAAVNNDAKVIHISTDYVFDGTNTIPYVETDPVCPKSVYGKSKQEGESALIDICLNAIIIRTSWLYSIYGNNFVKTMIKLGHERENLNVVADQVGTPTNAADLARAIVKILDRSESVGFETGIYHFSNEGQTSWYEFTLAIHSYAGITTCKVDPISTEQYPTKAQRPRYSVLDKNKISRTFDICIPDWKNSLKKCISELI